MDTITTILAFFECHPVLMQSSAILAGAVIALISARIAYRGIKEQIAATLMLERKSRENEKIAIYGAFAADLDALKKSLKGFHAALMDKDTTKERLLGNSVFLATGNVVWETCATKIGLLHPNHAANIIETYRFIEGMKGRVKEMNMEDANDGMIRAYPVKTDTHYI